MTKENSTSLLLAFEDYSLGSLYQEYMQKLGFVADLLNLKTNAELLSTIGNQQYNAIVFGLTSSNSKAIEMVADFRTYNQLPLFVILPENQKEDIVSAYRSGADSVDVQPLSPEILSAKIDAQQRRHYIEHNVQTIWQLGSLTFDSEKQILKEGEEPVIHLSGKENDLLQLLVENQGFVVERSTILKKIWKADNYFSGRSLSVYVNHLRNIFKPYPFVHFISLHGKGYKLIVD